MTSAPAADRPDGIRRPRWRAVVAVVMVLVLGLPLAAMGWLLLQYPHTRGPGGGQAVQIEIAPGAELGVVALQLARVGAVHSPRLWQWHARLRGAQPRLRSGLVMLYDNMTPREVLQRVARGYGSAQLRITVPEGQTRFDIARKLARWGVCDAEAFVAATEDPTLLRGLGVLASSAEGLLFPDTYQLQDDMEPSALVRRFVGNARRRTAELLREQQASVARLRRELGWGLPQIVTLASIVEREAASREEQPIIAGVFLNRLRDPGFKPKRLQADPTVAYGCLMAAAMSPSCAEFDGLHVTRAMLADAQNPYNTYRLEGLPPGPICNPGLSAIAAVLSPAEHPYFYFVAKGGGQHQFSESLEDHNTAVEQQRAPRW